MLKFECLGTESNPNCFGYQMKFKRKQAILLFGKIKMK